MLKEGSALLAKGEDFTLERHYGAAGYREDIQGLRAVGAITIMVFHIWFNKVSGGVDIFIVVSGFLMTALLMRGFLGEGMSSVWRFWSRIIVRIAPSAYVVLLGTLAAGFYLLPPSLIKGFVNEVIAAMLHLENFLLMRRSVDYLASDIPASPVQQFWALSVQVQFYALLPFVLLPLALWARRVRSPLPLVLGFALLLAASFLYATAAVARDPVSTYFNTFARGWEFLAGGLLFLLSPWARLRNGLAPWLSVLGLALVAASAALIPRGAHFPGPVALFPVAAALLVILSGLGSHRNRLLASRPLVFIGGMSFTLYLWHWPLLVFYREFFNAGTVGLVPGLLIILLSFGLSYLTKTLVESPTLLIPRRKAVSGYVIGALFLAPVATLASFYRSELNQIQSSVMVALEKGEIAPREEAGIRLEEDPIAVDRAELIAARDTLPAPYEMDCHQSQEDDEAITCEFGDLSSERVVVLVGGSHATQWLPALEEIGEDNGFKIVNMTKSSCPFGVVEDSNASCVAWNANALEAIVQLDPVAVITNSTRTEPGEESVPEGYVENWRALARHGIPVLGIRDNPRFDFDVPECLHRNRLDYLECAVAQEEVLAEQDPAREYAALITSIDMTDAFCADGLCPVTYEGFLIYRDTDHVHVPYVMYLSEMLERRMERAFPELFG